MPQGVYPVPLCVPPPEQSGTGGTGPHRLRYDAEATHHPPMDSSKPCPETWALHASTQIAAQAMNLARIYRSDSPAGCAESKPEVFAALIQAQPLNRIADALGALERIANALEAGTRAEGAQPATSPAAAPEEPAPLANPVASWGGWRRDQTSFVNSSRGFVEVPEGGRLAILPIGRKFRAKDFWAVDPGDRWAPIVAFVDWSFVEEPASTPTTAHQEPPTGDPDTLALGTSQERHTSGLGALQGEGQGQDVPEGEQGGQEGPAAAPGGHPLDRDGWIRSRLPAEKDATANGRVKVPHGRGRGWWWNSWHVVTPGQPWAPPTTEPSP